ncbi:hypothetical protein [Sedimentibacter sp.]|uniref:hypothetical protein n=1 Tax=Sedimentibacter sp. TaxID=1960295 RepID=UPI0028B07AD8|nr:hypothetical protein [Sedimentibacter sp.]
MIDSEKLMELFDYWCKKLRVFSYWDVKLEFITDPNWVKTGDLKIDCDDKKAIVLINIVNPKHENLEEVIVHELFHLKMYPLDQVTESLITANFKEDTPEYEFAYTQFYMALEQTVEELAKCFLLEFGEIKAFSYGRCKNNKSYNELFEGLQNL